MSTLKRAFAFAGLLSAAALALTTTERRAQAADHFDSPTRTDPLVTGMVRFTRARPLSVVSALETTPVSASARRPEARALAVGTRSVIFSWSKVMT